MRRKRIQLCLLLVTGLFGVSSYVSFGGKQSPQVVRTRPAQKIELLHADVLTFDKEYRSDVQRLIGNVSFRHGNATMSCDSAYLNEELQSFEAFGNVHMIQADTVNIYARRLNYDGITRVAQLRDEVKLENTTTTLFTDNLDYDRVTDIAYYFNGGSIVDSKNTLVSDYGEFHPKTNDAEFRYNVHLTGDNTDMTTEHLFYNTKTQISRFAGETQLLSDSGRIVSRRGVYDSQHDVGILLDRSEVYSRSRKLVGDSIYYDGKLKRGEAFGQMVITDTVQQADLYGDYGFYDDERNYAFVTSRAYAKDYSQRDTIYIGADTLELVSYPNVLRGRDSNILRDQDSIFKVSDTLARELRAYHRVKVYRKDAQAVADSMSYSSVDSILKLYQSPVAWSEERQLSGDTLLFYFKNRKLDYVDVLSHALAVEKLPDTPDYYNQLKGDSIRAYMQDSTVRRIEVRGSVESIHYMRDDKAARYTGMDRQTSGAMFVDLLNGKLQKTLWLGEVVGKAYPLSMATTSEINRLGGFSWQAEHRPRQWQDVVLEVDTTHHEHPYSLAALKRFSGAQAAVRAYEPIDKRVGEELEEQKQQKEATTIVEIPTYLDRDSKGYDTNKILEFLWPYKVSIDNADLDNLSTNPSIGILERKSSSEESDVSEMS